VLAERLFPLIATTKSLRVVGGVIAQSERPEPELDFYEITYFNSNMLSGVSYWRGSSHLWFTRWGDKRMGYCHYSLRVVREDKRYRGASYISATYQGRSGTRHEQYGLSV
jgi:hypothetical protein